MILQQNIITFSQKIPKWINYIYKIILFYLLKEKHLQFYLIQQENY